MITHNFSFINCFIHNKFISATGTRFQVKKNNKKLLPYTIITNSLSRISLQPNSVIHSISDRNNTTNSMLLATARKARFDEMPNSSGHPSEDVEHFLKSIKNMTKANDESDNHEIVRDFEIEFRNRFFSTAMSHSKFDKLKQQVQLHDELITSYIDDVTNLCRESDTTMSDSIIIQHLLSEINPELSK
ncbi:unnamed protein product [Rotaria magnacalcarata]|uniref:Retrotransposon gag domain-containing protein n=2 Tax=Rotaria magnacalcarata TaxID=392030 RepID=A0A815IK96_9BILA|nr:unnamed protein product [Rotaria magnacalcarata]CAF3914025.1 unnamed protein product [Rotaria magnacalcarata]CAF4063138.1 unnamed protein product [Rotaria magnacalcarata]CAF4083508.1 unnamed protein product [Rotaria magnacalcarata]